ncbi:MAG: hypothetical protein ACHP7O_04030 [Burkholderiales bacterium]
MSNSAFDAGIPVLTEIIHAAELDAASVSQNREERQEHLEAADAAPIDGWLNEEWNRLERKIGGRILDQVMVRLEADIEERIRDALADILQTTADSLAADIRQTLQHTLHEVIFQAVRDEIIEMQTSAK